MAVVGYERPNTIEEALGCLGRPGAVLVGGGTKVNAARTLEPVVIVDLQALDLDRIDRVDDRSLRIGATVTLQQLADDGQVPDLVREAARREEPSALRTMATVGGCVATANSSSELLAVLLVYDATVTVVQQDGTITLTLAKLLSELPLRTRAIVSTVSIAVGGVSSVARAARTRADRPIVAAVARRTPAGQSRLALTGVAATPVLVERVPALDPPEDFRGSSEYRRALGVTLSARVLEQVA
jgi:putative selenate reductase FAD-binding subunit